MEVKIIAQFRCPRCTSVKRVLDTIHKDLVLTGKNKPADVYFYQRDVVKLAPIGSAIATVPIIAIYSDICADCGTNYIFRIDRLDAPIQFIMPKVSLS